MGTAVLEVPSSIGARAQIGNLGAFFDPSSDEALDSKQERLIRALMLELDTYLLAAISARSEREFIQQRKTVWLKYIRSLRALQDTFSNMVSEPVIEQLSIRAISSLESDFHKKGDAMFGSKLKNQALFTLWTVNEIRVLGREIVRMELVDADEKKQDLELAKEYLNDSLWAQFHLDCLVASIKFDVVVCQEIRSEVCEGLRTAVNAFAIMKDAEGLRIKASDIDRSVPANLPWDDEDERLLDASMRDVDADFSKD